MFISVFIFYLDRFNLEVRYSYYCELINIIDYLYMFIIIVFYFLVEIL